MTGILNPAMIGTFLEAEGAATTDPEAGTRLYQTAIEAEAVVLRTEQTHLHRHITSPQTQMIVSRRQ